MGVILILIAFICAIIAIIFRAFNNDAEAVFGGLACVILIIGCTLCIK